MSSYTVTTSSELMENYIQSDFLLPQDKFLALQTDAGASLLFTIGTGGVFNLTVESPGQTHGWRQFDLGATQIKADFDGHSNATVKDFGVAQRVLKSSAAEIHMAMVVDDGSNDHLYVSLVNSSSDLIWIGSPQWTAAPPNAADGTGNAIPTPSSLRIANVFISEATDAEYIVVDTLRDPTQPATSTLVRYWIDMTIPSQPKWTLHNLAIDIEAQGYKSCLGRSTKAHGVDGLYTAGIIGTSAQLVYTPLYNYFDPGMPPLPSRLSIPGGLVADAIAAVRNPDNNSDLYAVADGGLYWFASDNQHDGSVGVLVFRNVIFQGAHTIWAYTDNGTTTVWGLNSNDQVFYITCPTGQQSSSGSWSMPLPIMTGVDAISPYVNRNYNANTFFAHSGDGLLMLVKSPTTGLWSRRKITLPPCSTTKAATPIHSHTTHIKVNDMSGKAAPNVAVSLSASNVTSVYINHLYYIVGPDPIQLTTDNLGTVTVVETTTTLSGTRFQVAVDSAPAISVNTMDTAWQRNAQYSTTDKLKSAKIVSRDGTTRALVPDGTKDSDLDLVAKSNESLGKAYAGLATTPASTSLRSTRVQSTHSLKALGSLEDAALVDLGDLFSWLESGIEAAIDIIEDAANEVWRFVARIGDAIYHGVLDCVEAVMAAATWVYNAIKVVIEDIILFLEFLFGWQDILVTHRVLKNLFLCLTQEAVDDVESMKPKVVQLFQQLQGQINSWADIPAINDSPSSTSAANPAMASQNSAPANLGVHHFQGAAGSSSSNISALTPVEDIFKDLVSLMEAEGDVLSDTVNAIKTDIIDQFNTLSVTEIMKRFLAIATNALLQTAENVIITLLDVIAQLIMGVVDLLNQKLDIPILSWLYSLLTGDDLSFLDLVCLVVAIPTTIMYKAATDTTPFSNGDAFTEGLLAAKSFIEIKQLFFLPSAKAANLHNEKALTAAVVRDDDPEPLLDQSKLKTFGFVTGIVALFGGTVLVVATNAQRLFDELGVEYAKKTLATIICASNIAYVSPNIATLVSAKTDNWYANLNNTLTGISILKGMVAIPAVDSDNDSVGSAFAMTESFINFVWNLPVIMNIVANKDTFDSTYKSLIPESIGNFFFNFGGMLEFLIVRTKNPDYMIAQAVFMEGYGLMMVVAGGIYDFAPDQQH